VTDEQPREENRADDIPELEDASEPEARAEVVDDDDREVELDMAARSLDGDDPATALSSDDEDQQIEAVATTEDDDLSDVAHIPDEPPLAANARTPQRVGDWECEPSAHKVVVELKRVENEVRTLLENGDTRRKRKFGGTQRWHELEEDIIAWRYGGRFNEDALRRLQELVARRHFLFRRLSFRAGTRPVMNS